MCIYMAGVDARSADVSAREPFAFSEEQVRHILAELMQKDGISGAVLLATCNRTELYLSLQERPVRTKKDGNTAQPEDTISPARLLQQYAASPADASAMTILTETDAVQHLMEVACGLHSQILHEEQIVTQVGHAVELARSCHSTDGVLDTLFRTAVSAGKDAQTQVSVSSVPLSVSYGAVQQLEQQLGGLEGKTCLVIGSGSMGRLAASLLMQRGCQVFMTLRSCHCGETVIPFGVKPVPYEQRYAQMESADIVVSATRSPHNTILRKPLENLCCRPAWILDLAMPRDVESSCGEIEGVTLWDLDDLHSDTAPDAAALTALHQIAEQYTDTFQMWRNYRDSVPYMQQLKELTAQRILHSTAAEPYQEMPQLEELVRMVTEKTVDMLMGSMKAEIRPELLRQSCAKIKDRGRF